MRGRTCEGGKEGVTTCAGYCEKDRTERRKRDTAQKVCACVGLKVKLLGCVQKKKNKA